MKNKIKSFVLLYVVFLIFSVACDSNCKGARYAKIASFEAENVKIELVDDYYTVNNLDDNSVIYSDFGIEIHSIDTYYSQINKSFFSKMYACSPNFPRHTDKLINVEIFADQDFDASYVSGVNLKDYFEIVDLDKNQSYSINTYLLEQNILPSRFSLQLKQMPSETKNFTFTVKIYMAGSGIDFYEFTTSSIEIRTE